MPIRLSAFPKCYLDAIAGEKPTMTVFDWIAMARDLDADGLEMYDGFFTSLEPAYLDSIGEAISTAGFDMPMLCCSPDFTNPDADARQRAVEREAAMIAVTRRLGGPGAVCRVLSGQRYPGLAREQGLHWVVECIESLLPVAREHGIILGLENHYKDGFWRYPEFAQKKDVFLELLALINDTENFGVQYDPSNALVAGDDPIAIYLAGRRAPGQLCDTSMARIAAASSLLCARSMVACARWPRAGLRLAISACCACAFSTPPPIAPGACR